MDEASPAWLAPWCTEHLGSAVQDVLFATSAVSQVYGVRLFDGRAVVVKSRPESLQRIAGCLAMQRSLAVRGFPCPLPLTLASARDTTTVHAEEYWPGGDVARGDDPDVAARFAVLLAELAAMTDQIDVTPPLPNPLWVRWDHTGPGVWPSYPSHPGRIAGAVAPRNVEDIARRVRVRLSGRSLAAGDRSR